MENTSTSIEAPSEWLDALARSDDDLAAGRVTDGTQVRQRLRESIARMEARPKLNTVLSSRV